MKRIILGVFSVILFSCLNIYSQDVNCGNRCVERSGDNFVSIYSYTEKKQFIFDITIEELARTPVWNPRENNPPLSIKDAVDAADNWIKNTLNGYEKLKLNKVEIRNLQQYFFYVVWFKIENSKTESFFKVIILMNGKTIEPKIDKFKD